MRTIQSIELLDLTKLTMQTLYTIRNDLNISYYHTRCTEFCADGRNRKDLIGYQLDRVSMEINRRCFGGRDA